MSLDRYRPDLPFPDTGNSPVFLTCPDHHFRPTGLSVFNLWVEGNSGANIVVKLKENKKGRRHTEHSKIIDSLRLLSQVLRFSLTKVLGRIALRYIEGWLSEMANSR